jgi:hypothetical protein
MVDVSVLPRRLIANVAGGLAVIYLLLYALDRGAL